MKRRLTFLMVITLASAIALTGCWDAVPIEGRDIATALGVDSSGTDSPDRLYTDILLSSSKEAEHRAYPVSGVAVTPGESRDERRRNTSNRILFGQVQVVLFGEDAARQGVNVELDTLIRFPQLSYSVHTAVCQGRASDYLALPTNEQFDMGSHLEEQLHKAPETIPLPNVTLHELVYDVVTPHRHAVLPYLTIRTGEPFLGGVALFKADRLVTVLEEEEASLLTMLRRSGVFGSHAFTYETPKGSFMATLTGSSTRKVQASYQNGRWFFTIGINFTGRVVDKSMMDGLKDAEQTETVLKPALQADLEQQLNSLVHRLQSEIKIDALDLSDFAVAQRRKELENVDWDEEFQRAEIKLKVNVNIADMGEGT